MTSISFGSFYDNSVFDLYGSDLPNSEDCCNAVASVVDATPYGRSGNVIGIGAWASGSGFKVKGFTVTYEVEDMTPVPLPAAGWLLIAGLGGLGAMKRRSKKKAA